MPCLMISNKILIASLQPFLCLHRKKRRLIQQELRAFSRDFRAVLGCHCSIHPANLGFRV